MMYDVYIILLYDVFIFCIIVFYLSPLRIIGGSMAVRLATQQ